MIFITFKYYRDDVYENEKRNKIDYTYEGDIPQRAYRMGKKAVGKRTRRGKSKGTLRNDKDTIGTGVFDKYYKSFKDLKGNWSGDNTYIQLIIMSLDQKVLIHRKIKNTDLDDLKKLRKIFFKGKYVNIKEIEGNGWKKFEVKNNVAKKE